MFIERISTLNSLKKMKNFSSWGSAVAQVHIIISLAEQRGMNSSRGKISIATYNARSHDRQAGYTERIIVVVFSLKGTCWSASERNRSAR